MNLYYFADNKGQVIVSLAGDDTPMTPDEALEHEAELVFGWHKEGMKYLLSPWDKIGFSIVESTIEEFERKGGVFSQAATFCNAIK